MIIYFKLVLSGTEVPDIQLMPPTPQQTTLTESGSGMKDVSRQATHPEEEILEEQEEQESTGDERKSLDGLLTKQITFDFSWMCKTFANMLIVYYIFFHVHVIFYTFS